MAVFAKKIVVTAQICLAAWFCFFATFIFGAEDSGKPLTSAQRAEKVFSAAREQARTNQNDAEVLWKFARASFDWAEFVTNNRQREQIAAEAIVASRKAISLKPSAAAHYYLGMNLGQLARTKTLGALKLVEEMEREFKKARELDEQFDFAGPDRNLGLLYLEAPPISVGDKKKARAHLRAAVKLSPNYPENHLNLIEANLRWKERDAAAAQLAALETLLPAAKENLSGPEWETSWLDWNNRISEVKRKLSGAKM